MFELPDNFVVRITPCNINDALHQLARKLNTDYRVDEKLLVVMVANGGIYFGVDLTRLLNMLLLVDVVCVSSYENNQRTDNLKFNGKPKLNPNGLDVLLVDDIYDSGNTIEKLKCYYLDKGAKSVKSCVFINKLVGGRNGQPDYFCRTFENEFAIGYGLDYNELYRNFDFIGVKNND